MTYTDAVASSGRFVSLVGVAASLALACTPPSPSVLPDPLRPSASSPRDSSTPSASAAPSSPGTLRRSSSGPPAVAAPPLDSGIRRRRVVASLPPGGADPVWRDPIEGGPYAVVLQNRGPGNAGDRWLLALVDVRRDPGTFLGRHDFIGVGVGLGRAFALATERGDAVVLAEMEEGQGVRACGWWLPAGSPRFLCAPKVVGPSRYDTVGALLVESWPADFPPMPEGRIPLTGRMFRLSPTGRWSEVEGFRCLGLRLEEAVAEAGGVGLRRWQRDGVARRVRVALRESRAFDDEQAIELLRDAIVIDSCAAEPWRLLGRLEFQAGRNGRAVPALATAVSLASHEDAPLVDLADALAAIDIDGPEAREALMAARELLARSRRNQPLVLNVSTTRQLARVLYHTYLERTADAPDRHRSRRRRVQRQLAELP